MKTSDENFWTEAYSVNCTSSAFSTSVLCYICCFTVISLLCAFSTLQHAVVLVNDSVPS